MKTNRLAIRIKPGYLENTFRENDPPARYWGKKGKRLAGEK